MDKKFDSSSVPLSEMLGDAAKGKLQLPDFQRGWVWDDDHIRSLLASISVSYPIGAVMTLVTGNPEVKFRPRPVEGVELPGPVEPEYLLLDGQQRATSLYLALHSSKAVPTRDSRGKSMLRHYYADIRACIDPFTDREEAIVSVPEDRVQTFRNEVVLNVSTRQAELAAEMFPLDIILDPVATMEWQYDYIENGPGDRDDRFKTWQRFAIEVVAAFIAYQVPTIELAKSTPKDAVCQVFEKVNTGGVSLTVFELLTATYAADDFNLREDWDERRQRIHAHKVLERYEATDFIQTITILSTYERRLAVIESGETERAPAVSGKRKDMLRLELSEYRKWADLVTEALEKVVRFLHAEHMYTANNLPYASQLVPLTATFAKLGSALSPLPATDKLRRWFWCGIFGEMYGGASESRFSNDLVDLDSWIVGDGDEPRTIRDAQFQADRLLSLRSRVSAAYKGLFALQMKRGGRDFRTGSPISAAVYFDDAIDIHHIFPKAWCDKNGIESWIADSAVNKTAIDAHTNRYIGARPPSEYLKRIEDEDGTSNHELDRILLSHDIDPHTMRSDDFPSFFNSRFEALVQQIESVMGKPVNRNDLRDESPFVDHVPAQLPPVNIVELVSDGESRNAEHKSTARFNPFTGTTDPNLEWSALKTIAGFANAEGGLLIVGVDDDGGAVGIEGDYSTLRKKDRDGWELWLTDAVSSSMSKVAATLLNVRFGEYKDVDVAVIDVRPSRTGPIFAKEPKGDGKLRFMVRINNSTQELEGEEADKYKRTRWPDLF